MHLTCVQNVGWCGDGNNRERERLYSGMMLCFVWDLNQYFVEVELKRALNTKIIYHHCAMTNLHAYLIHVSKYYYYTQQFMWSLVRKKLSTLWLGPHIVLKYSSGLYVGIVFKDEAKLAWFFIWLLFWQDSMYYHILKILLYKDEVCVLSKNIQHSTILCGFRVSKKRVP